MSERGQGNLNHLVEWRQLYTKVPLTREGELFEVETLAKYLTSQEFCLPKDCLEPNRYRVVCIDDGIATLDYR